MKPLALLLPAVLAAALPDPANAACCFFSAQERDVLQPAQKVFITWDPGRQQVAFTVQPRFEGDAREFGMVIPTPSRPALDEMPKDFFPLLGTFTIMEPMDLSKYKPRLSFRSRGALLGLETDAARAGRRKSSVRVVEAGVVGTLDYKIVTADRPDDLFDWLKEHRYSYSGDEATLERYIRQRWYFTVMKIDPRQIAGRQAGERYEGEITPTRFTYRSETLVYPLKITQVSVKDTTEALFYIQAPTKMDLPPDLSYQDRWQPQWKRATGFAIPEKLTPLEKAWDGFLTDAKLEAIEKRLAELYAKGITPATLEWAKRITDEDIGYISGEVAFNREAPEEEIGKLRQLRGHIRQGQFVTKIRKVFRRDEMDRDLVFVPARVDGRADPIEYYQVLPLDPP